MLTAFEQALLLSREATLEKESFVVPAAATAVRGAVRGVGDSLARGAGNALSAVSASKATGAAVRSGIGVAKKGVGAAKAVGTNAAKAGNAVWESSIPKKWGSMTAGDKAGYGLGFGGVVLAGDALLSRPEGSTAPAYPNPQQLRPY